MDKKKLIKFRRALRDAKGAKDLGIKCFGESAAEAVLEGARENYEINERELQASMNMNFYCFWYR